MKSALPLIVIAVLLLGMLLFARRNRERQAAQQVQLRERITFGTEVMTTSGLYGTVVGLNPDETVQLSIAPGIEVKWALAALRDVESLPNQYREPLEPEEEKADEPPDDTPPR
ncbi:MAG TPA: preprotein translocase subunit YajC [Jatrophihabitantaceae bacterium]